MKQRFTRVLFATLLWLLPHQAFSQTTDAGITVVGLASFQPVDDSYVGGPYLSEGLGGVAAGFGIGGDVIFPNGLALAVEYSTARFEQEQSGRLVVGEGVPATSTLHDSLVSGLIGYATTSEHTRLLVLGGLSATLDSPTVNGVERDDVDPDGSDVFPLVLTGGIDFRHAFNARVAFLAGGRYSYIDRQQTLQYLGIGPHVLRANIGLRFRIN
jgi:hypothetical protein